MLFFFMWPFVYSCSENLAVPEKKDIPVEISPLPVSIGKMHNECVINYITAIGEKYPNRVPLDVARKVLVDVMNDVAETNGISERVTDEMFDEVFARMRELREKGTVNFFAPENIDLGKAMTSFVSSGAINQQEAEKHLLTFQTFKKNLKNNIDKNVNVLNTPDVSLEDPAADVLYSSSVVWWVEMEMYIADHPELQGWWDYWKNKIQTIGLLMADFLGGACLVEFGGIWPLVGALLASTAFTIAFVE
jgi:hypothetical protein